MPATSAGASPKTGIDRTNETRVTTNRNAPPRTRVDRPDLATRLTLTTTPHQMGIDHSGGPLDDDKAARPGASNAFATLEQTGSTRQSRRLKRE